MPAKYTKRTKPPKVPADADLGNLFSWIGIAMTQWQEVEDAHYLLFLKLLGAPKPEICSVIYFSPPTFESRRVMVDRVAYYAITDAEHKKEWRELNKRMGDCAHDRGKIAHYRLDFEISIENIDPVKVKLGEPRLAPSSHNMIAALKGHTAEERLVTSTEIRGYIADFMGLKKDVEDFTKRVPFPPQQQGLGLLSNLLPFLGSEETTHLSLPTPKPSGDPPSEQ
jgi:hypothetical protein